MKRINLILSLLVIYLTPLLLASCIPKAENDRGKIIFQSDLEENWSYYQIFPDGSNLQKEINLSKIFLADNYFPLIPSYDNTKIAFSADFEGNYEIFVIDLYQDKMTNITNSDGDEYDFSWSPDGALIAFVSDNDSILVNSDMAFWTNDLYFVNIEENKTHKISNDNTQNQYGSISWSPDGKHLAYSVFTQSKNGPLISSICVYDISTSEERIITEISDEPRYRSAWSPNNKQIMYFEDGGYNRILYVINMDGSNRIQISNASIGYIEDAHWSPNGNEILISSKKDESYFIYTIDADGTNLQNITSTDKRIDTDPYWSPDGKQIVFSSRYEGENNQLFVMDKDGRNSVAITDVKYDSTSPIWIVNKK